MVNGIIKKTELKKLGEAVSKDNVFYVPVRGSDGISLVPFDPENEIELNYSNFKQPPKRLFFPQVIKRKKILLLFWLLSEKKQRPLL